MKPGRQLIAISYFHTERSFFESPLWGDLEGLFSKFIDMLEETEF